MKVEPAPLLLGLRFLREMRLDNNVPLHHPADYYVVLRVGKTAMAMQPSWTDDQIDEFANGNVDDNMGKITPELNEALEAMFSQLMWDPGE